MGLFTKNGESGDRPRQATSNTTTTLKPSSSKATTTSLRPPGYPSPEEEAASSSVAGRGQPAPPSTLGRMLFESVAFAGALIVFNFIATRRGSRAEKMRQNTQLIASLREEKARAAAGEVAWRDAYKSLAAGRGGGGEGAAAVPPAYGQPQPQPQRQTPSPPPPQRYIRPGQIATAPPTHHSPTSNAKRPHGSAFINPYIAQQAAREEQEALDQMEIGGGSGRRGSTFFGDMAGGTNHFVGMATGRGDPFPGGGPWRKGGAAASGWSRSRGDGHGRSSATSGCAATAVGLNPRQRWQRAFGGGATGAASPSTIAATQSVGNDDAAWERLAQRQAARSKATASLDDVDGDSGKGSASTSPSKAGAERAAKRLAEIRKEAKKLKSKRVDKAIMDELDAAFFANHLGGGAPAGEQTVQRSGSEGTSADDSATATSSTSRDQHVSMDNVFLEEQLKEAAEEGREARLEREEREARFNGNSDGIKKAIDELLKERSFNKQAMSATTGAPDVDGHRDARSASKKEERDREFDRLVEELGVAALGWPSSSATDKAAIAAEVARDATTPSASASQSRTQPQQVDSESAPSSSLLDACLDHAAQEGRRVRAGSSSSSSPLPSHGPAAPPLHRSHSSAEYDPHGELDAPSSMDTAKEARADKLMDEAIAELRKRVESMNDQVGRMNVWADEVHRRMGYHGRYPGSRDKPN